MGGAKLMLGYLIVVDVKEGGITIVLLLDKSIVELLVVKRMVELDTLLLDGRSGLASEAMVDVSVALVTNSIVFSVEVVLFSGPDQLDCCLRLRCLRLWL